MGPPLFVPFLKDKTLPVLLAKNQQQTTKRGWGVGGGGAPPLLPPSPLIWKALPRGSGLPDEGEGGRRGVAKIARNNAGLGSHTLLVRYTTLLPGNSLFWPTDWPQCSPSPLPPVLSHSIPTVLPQYSPNRLFPSNPINSLPHHTRRVGLGTGAVLG